jgi:hypothetical protein
MLQNIPNQPHRADRDRIEKCIGFGARSGRLSGKSVSSPVEKNFSFGFELKSLLSRALSCTRQRGVRVVTDVGCGMRWMRRHQKTNDAEPHTAKPCGPDAPMLASSWRRCQRITSDDASHRTEVMSLAHHADEGGKKARSPGRARSKPLKPLRREGRSDPTTPVVTNSCVFVFYTRGRGCGRHPVFPAPSLEGRAAPSVIEASSFRITPGVVHAAGMRIHVVTAV